MFSLGQQQGCKLKQTALSWLLLLDRMMQKEIELKINFEMSSSLFTNHLNFKTSDINEGTYLK